MNRFPRIKRLIQDYHKWRLSKQVEWSVTIIQYKDGTRHSVFDSVKRKEGETAVQSIRDYIYFGDEY